MVEARISDLDADQREVIRKITDRIEAELSARSRACSATTRELRTPALSRCYPSPKCA